MMKSLLHPNLYIRSAMYIQQELNYYLRLQYPVVPILLLDASLSSSGLARDVSLPIRVS
jgi:hypothetical protein